MLTARAFSPQFAYMAVESTAELQYDGGPGSSLGGWGEAEIRRLSVFTLPNGLARIIVSVEIEKLHAPLAQASGFLILILDSGEEVFGTQETITHEFFVDGRSARKLTLNLSLRVVGELQPGPEGFSAAWATASVAMDNEVDCDANGVPDEIDLATGTGDCNKNTILDRCERELDCNGNRRPDECDLADGLSDDCNLNQRPDECDVYRFEHDCDSNGEIDSCEIPSHPHLDCDASGKLDECEILSGLLADCDNDGGPDRCQIDSGLAQDCNGNTIPDHCELATSQAFDCNGNSALDACDVAGDPSTDENNNGFPDECEVTIYVDARAPGANTGLDWNNAYTTLGAALAHANAAGGAVPEVRVAQGTYTPSHRTDLDNPRSATFLVHQPLALRGGFAGIGSPEPDAQDPMLYPTILSGDLDSNDDPSESSREGNAYHVISSSSPHLFIERVTVSGGNANGAARSGGGILFSGGTLQVVECTFTENSAGSSNAPAAAQVMTGCASFHGGGAIHVAEGMLIVDSCGFEFNSAPVGGAILARDLHATGSHFWKNDASCGGAIGIDGGSADICDSVFSENSALGGGALYAYGAEIEASEARFYFNSAYWGGAVELVSSRRVLFDSCSLTANTATYDGGGVYFDHHDPEFPPTFSEIRARSNFARRAGGVLYSDGELIVENSEFVSNSCGETGGVIASQQVRISDSQFRENQAAEGGALFTWAYSPDFTVPTIMDSQFYANSAVLGGAASLHNFWIERCEFSGNTGEVGGGVALTSSEESWLRNSVVGGNHAA